MPYTSDEFVTGPFTNLFYILGRLETGSLGQKDLIGCEVMLEIALEEMERFGFRLSASNARSIIDILKNRHYSTNLHDHILMLRNALHAELEATVFLPIDPSNARFYREPRRDWEEAIERFPEAISDIEEASKCYALGRYAASVYHSMQIIEIGLLAKECLQEGLVVAHIHLRHISPLPKNLRDLLAQYDNLLVPELNTGQLATLLRDKLLADIQQLNKVSGQPLTVAEVKEAIARLANPRMQEVTNA